MAAGELDLKGLGLAIVRHRHERGWTMNRLAERSGVPNPYLRRLEAGEPKTVGLETVAKIAAAFRMPVDILLGEAGLPISRPQIEELDNVYNDLGAFERLALLENARTLRDVQAGYAAMQEHEERRVAEEPGEFTPDATRDVAYDDAEQERQAKEDTEDEGS